MTNPNARHALCTVLAIAGIAIATAATQAAVVTDTAATWPGSPDAQTVDVLTNDETPNGRGISTTRQIRQTFQVANDFTVGAIVLSIGNYGDVAFTIKIFQVADIVAANWSAGTQVGSTITVAAFGSTTTGTSNLEITLSGAEQFLIAQRNTGNQGYGMEIALVNTAGAAAFTWQHTIEVGNLAPGRHYRETGVGQDVTLDMGLALVAPQVVPTPAALPAGLAMLGLVAMRRRRSR